MTTDLLRCARICAGRHERCRDCWLCPEHCECPKKTEPTPPPPQREPEQTHL